MIDTMRDVAALVCPDNLGHEPPVRGRVAMVDWGVLDAPLADDARAIALMVETLGEVDGETQAVTAKVAHLTEPQVTELLRHLVDWLDAPRLEARQAPTIVLVAPDSGIALVSTTAGEWGVASVVIHRDGTVLGALVDEHDPIDWCASEVAARKLYAEERGLELCDVCHQESDDVHEAGEDGPRLCPPCIEIAVAEWRATPAACLTGDGGCGWAGTCAELRLDDDRETTHCPRCDADDIHEGELAHVAEAAAP